jgi:hypothetical protein
MARLNTMASHSRFDCFKQYRTSTCAQHKTRTQHAQNTALLTSASQSTVTSAPSPPTVPHFSLRSCPPQNHSSALPFHRTIVQLVAPLRSLTILAFHQSAHSLATHLACIAYELNEIVVLSSRSPEEMTVVLDPDLLWGIHEPGPLAGFLVDTWAALLSAIRVLASVQVRIA